MIPDALSHDELARHLRGSRVDFPYQPVRQPAIHRAFSNIKAVVFDFYDTLILTEPRPFPAGLPVSAVLPGPLTNELLRRGASLPSEAVHFARALDGEIKAEHSRRRAAEPGLIQPEIDIRVIWRAVLGSPLLCPAILEESIALWEAWSTRSRVARGAPEMLAALHDRGILLGIASNAQFLGPALFASHFGATPSRHGIHPMLEIWSFRHLVAKPDPRFFTHLREKATSLSLAPEEILFVGNDPSRDIAPASRAGFHTCLYAGDQRCLRPPCPTQADAVILNFADLPGLLD